MADDLMTTGEAARLLGCSRQHIVDLCDSGRLASLRVGTHRRVPRSDVESLVAGSQMSDAQFKSLLLHVGIAGKLVENPQSVLDLARANISRWRSVHRPDGRTSEHLRAWSALIEAGPDDVLAALLSRAPQASELRSSSPFAGVLTEESRRSILAAAHEVRPTTTEHALSPVQHPPDPAIGR